MVLGISFFAAFTVLIFLCKRKRYITGCVVAFVLLFSCVNPYIRYVRNELFSENLCDRYSDKEDAVYVAQAIDCSDYDSYSTAFVRLLSVDGEVLKSKPKARISSYGVLDLETGDEITFIGKPCKLSELEETDFDTSTYLRGKNTFIDFQSPKLLSFSIPEKTSFLQEIREYTKKVIFKYLYIRSSEPARVAYAMFSGNTDYLSSGTNSSFRESGIAHILCVSGLHLSIIVSALYSVLTNLTVGKKTKCIIISAFCIFYCAFTGFSLSTIRACIMTCTTFAAMIFGKRTDTYSSLFFAALLIFSFSPYSVFDLSAILSFLATFGIVLFLDVTPKFNFKSDIVNFLLTPPQPLTMGVGAFVFTIPVCAYFFGTISLFSVIATILVTPFCTFLMTGLLCLIIISPLAAFSFAVPIVEMTGIYCEIFAKIIIKISNFFYSFRFASISSLFTKTHIIILIVFLIIISVLVSAGKKRICFFCAAIMVMVGMIFSFLSLYSAIDKDTEYKVSYYRKNEDNRQLTIKLGTGGYLIVNADSEISINPKKVAFDTKNKKNYLLLIPDREVDPGYLALEIEYFDKQYGIKKIFVPNTLPGAELAAELSEFGIKCIAMPEKAQYNDITLEFVSDFDYKKLSVYDKDTKTEIVYGEHYSKSFFEKDADICAFFTRKTINQFDPERHELPDCHIFFTRMAKGIELDGVVNTNSKTRFYIKE